MRQQKFRLAVIAALVAQGSTQSIRTASTVVATPTPSATSTPAFNISNPVTNAFDATVWSLIYTYPLYIFGNFAGNVLKNVPINSILHQQTLATPDSPGVIKPNIDTLYSRAVLDLSKNDVVLTIPNVTDGRYWNYPVYDLFGNDIAEIGNLNNNTPGQYLIRRSDDVYAEPGLVLAKDNPLVAKPYQGYVNLPTTYGTILIRLFLKENTTADLDIIHRYQNASSLQEVPRNVTRAARPPGNLTSLAPNNSLLGIQTIDALLSFAAKITPYGQPENYTDRARVAGILGAAGVYDGAYHPVAGINLTQASAIANASILVDVTAPSHIQTLTSNWTTFIPSYQGNYAKNYGARAYVAIYGYQALTARQVIYPGYGSSLGFSVGFNLANNQSLLLSFSGKPQLKQSGFWSVSIYGADQYLIRNPLNRFEIGERSYNLTYQNTGKHVYGPSADAKADGPFQVLIQNVNATPPANWTGNWLPGSSSFTIITRFYAPQDSIFNGSYIFPKISTISSIR